MVRKLLIIPPIVLGIAVLAYFVLQRKAPETKPPEERARFVRVIEAPETAVVPRILGYGTVTPAKVWNAVAQVSGEIVYVHPDFKKGAILPKDTELVRISPADYELAIAQSEANIRSAEAKLKELEVSEENTKAALAIEKRALELREKELARKQELLKSGTVSQSSVDQESRDVLAQRQRVQDLENSLRLIPTQKTVQVEQQEVYKAQHEAAKLNLARTSVKMPFAARIAEANVEVAQFVQTGQALGVADGVEAAEVEAQVPIALFRQMTIAITKDELPVGITAENLQKIIETLGFHVVVRLRNGDRAVEWKGRFARVSDTIDTATRTVGVIVVVEGAYAQAVPGDRPPLTKGMFVEVELAARPTDPMVIVPRSALNEGKLYIANSDDRLDIRAVKTGLVQGGFVQITDGLGSGERVVVSDLSPAIEGMLLRGTPDTAIQDDLAKQAAGEVPLK